MAAMNEFFVAQDRRDLAARRGDVSLGLRARWILDEQGRLLCLWDCLQP